MEPRRRVLVRLIALAIVTFLDRISIAVASPHSGGIAHPAGALGDRMGQRSVLRRIVLWWSGFTCLTGAATGFVPLLATRFLFGAGEAGAYPNLSGAIVRWFPVRGRARTQGFIRAASRLDGVLSPLIVVPLPSAVGWRMTFVLLGAAGAVWSSDGRSTATVPRGLRAEARRAARLSPGSSCCRSANCG